MHENQWTEKCCWPQECCNSTNKSVPQWGKQQMFSFVMKILRMSFKLCSNLSSNMDNKLYKHDISSGNSDGVSSLLFLVGVFCQPFTLLVFRCKNFLIVLCTPAPSKCATKCCAQSKRELLSTITITWRFYAALNTVRKWRLLGVEMTKCPVKGSSRQ